MSGALAHLPRYFLIYRSIHLKSQAGNPILNEFPASKFICKFEFLLQGPISIMIHCEENPTNKCAASPNKVHCRVFPCPRRYVPPLLCTFTILLQGYCIFRALSTEQQRIRPSQWCLGPQAGPSGCVMVALLLDQAMSEQEEKSDIALPMTLNKILNRQSCQALETLHVLVSRFQH